MKAQRTIDEVVIYDRYRPHKRVVFDGTLTNPVTGEILTPVRRVKQEFRNECDINNILKQYKLTGQVAHIRANASQGAYTDLPEGTDFQEALNTVIAGQAAFATLPAKVRDRFGNDPNQFLYFMADPANQEEAIELGLATDTRGNGQKPPTTPPAPPVASPAPEPEKPPKS